jgi:hypothetical protein
LYVCPDVGGHSNYTMDGFGQNKTSFPFGFSVSNLLGQEPKKKKKGCPTGQFLPT